MPAGHAYFKVRSWPLPPELTRPGHAHSLLASPYPARPSVTPATYGSSPNSGTSTRIGQAQATTAPSSQLTINILNRLDTPLSIDYANNDGAPSAVGSPTAGLLSTSTQVVYPTEMAGRILLGYELNSENSKIEASFFNNTVHFDVSYVDGYTVPVVCGCDGVPKTGCSVDLFATGRTCPRSGPDPICYNDMKHVPHGPASSFFQPCENLAYTFPADDLADKSCESGALIDCCVGTGCPDRSNPY